MFVETGDRQIVSTKTPIVIEERHRSFAGAFFNGLTPFIRGKEGMRHKIWGVVSPPFGT
jgi:hypothetical protein